MLRIYIINEPYSVTVKVEGKIIQEWATELRNTWMALADGAPGKRTIVDLYHVSFVDDFGRQLLVDMHAAGAKLVGSGPMISAMLDDITSEKASHRPKALKKVLVSLVFVLVFLAAFRSFAADRSVPDAPTTYASRQTFVQPYWSAAEQAKKAGQDFQKARRPNFATFDADGTDGARDTTPNRKTSSCATFDSTATCIAEATSQSVPLTRIAGGFVSAQRVIRQAVVRPEPDQE
jgi:anti-anti-sigma regulatory factor